MNINEFEMITSQLFALNYLVNKDSVIIFYVDEKDIYTNYSNSGLFTKNDFKYWCNEIKHKKVELMKINYYKQNKKMYYTVIFKENNK